LGLNEAILSGQAYYGWHQQVLEISLLGGKPLWVVAVANPAWKWIRNTIAYSRSSIIVFWLSDTIALY
jgi:hypothetical protein